MCEQKNTDLCEYHYIDNDYDVEDDPNENISNFFKFFHMDDYEDSDADTNEELNGKESQEKDNPQQ